MRRWMMLAMAGCALFGLIGCSDGGNGFPVEDEVGMKYNIDKWDRFLENVKNKQKDQVRITLNSVEGDPIFYELKFDGKLLKYTYDNSSDKFGGTGKGRQSTVCTGIAVASDEGNGDYHILTGCKSESIGQTFRFYDLWR